MVLAVSIKPALEVCYLVFPQISYETAEDFNHSILGFILVFKVFKAKTQYKMAIATVQFSNDFLPSLFMVNGKQFLVAVFAVFVVAEQ